MTWTIEPPTVPGHYWCRFDYRDRAFVVDIAKRTMDGALVEEENGAEILSNQFKGCEWAGPIPQPVEPTP